MDSMFNTPQEVVQANMNGAVKKATTSKKKVFFMGIMAGVCIALGAQSSNVAMHDIANVGLARLVAGCVFPVGLMMIVFIGGELFTGDCMMTMACIKKKISVAALIRTLVIVYIGNMVGAVALAYLVYLSGQYNYTSGALGAFTIKVALGKVSLSFLPALISGILCNILMRCSIDGFYRERYSRKITCYLFPDHGIRCIRLRTLRCKYVLYSGRNLCFYESGLCCKSERIIWYHRQSDCCFKLGKLLHRQSSSCYNR